MRRALLVGIDEYRFGQLHGCVSDADKMHELLSRHEDGARNFDTRLLTAPIGSARDLVTRATLRRNLEELFADQADVVLFHFSGHGTASNLDGYLVTQDATAYDEGVPMSEVLERANKSPAHEVVILLDCCHSGHLGNPPAIDNKKSLLREGVSILTASRGDQPSLEAGGGGVFTSLVTAALEGGAADLLGNVSAPAIYAFVEAALGAWDQRPLFKSHVSKVISLRNCSPPIDRALLRRIPRLFPLPAEDLQLDPTFEKTMAGAVAANVATLEYLQSLNRVHLVEPIGHPHMYDVAVNSGSCRLTPSGRYFWRLAKDGRI